MRSKWTWRHLGDVAHIEMGQSPPSEHVSEQSDAGLPFLQGNAGFSALHPHPQLWCKKPLKSANRGDILISVRAPVGAINLADQSYCIGRGLAAIRFLQSDPDYGYHAISFFSSGLRKVAQGTTFEAISSNELRKLGFPEAPRPEQRRIAEILDNLDEAIRKTEQVIAKLQQMKQGLIHDLLTQGIDENGELRDPERHPEQFKDSPLGRIPRGWESQSLGSLAIDGITNGVFKEPHRVGSGVPLVNVSNLYRGFGVDLNHCEFFDANAEEKRQFAALSGDIFFTRSSLNLTGIAHCNVLRGCVDDAVYECHLMRVRPSASRVNPVFLALWSRSVFAQKFFMARAKQTTMTTISQPDIAPLPVPLPPLAEQDAIVDCYDAVDIQVSDEQATASKLSLFKQGLMDDLLTGRVRVIIEEGST